MLKYRCALPIQAKFCAGDIRHSKAILLRYPYGETVYNLQDLANDNPADGDAFDVKLARQARPDRCQ